MVRGETDKSSNDHQTRQCVARSMDPNWESRSDLRKARMGNRDTKLDDARRLRGIYFIDPDDGEYKEIIKNARRNEEVPMEAAMPCLQGQSQKRTRRARLRKLKGLGVSPTRFQKKKKKHACIVESHESTRQRAESSLTTNHEDHIASKTKNFFDPLQFCAQVYSDATSDENSRCKKLPWPRNAKSSRQTQHGIWKKSRAKRRLFWKHK